MLTDYCSCCGKPTKNYKEEEQMSITVNRYLQQPIKLTQILVRNGLFERPSLIKLAHYIFFKIL